MAREINLVPDIKNEVIKTLKLRNLIFFLCIVIAAASAGVAAITGAIAGGQQIAIDGKQGTIDKLSTKLSSFSDLGDYLTIKDQVNGIGTLTENKQVMSRTFGILSALIPTGPDTITISELNVSLDATQPTFDLEAQANAGQEPFIDYNVLDSFKKSMAYMHYDWGTYVDKEDNTIPAYCMIEQAPDGSILSDPEKGYYAYWTVEVDGCNPSGKSIETENYEGQQVFRIWRTPQFKEWYSEQPVENKPYMDESGQITGVEHFNSSCITYSKPQDSNKTKWDEENSCQLVNTEGVTVGDDSGEGGTVISGGINIGESSNGRDSSDDLVLRFNATIYLNPEVFKFSNTHMLALPPEGHHNVTDSYVQVQSLFGQRASDCAKGDTACNDSKNSGSQSNASQDNATTNTNQSGSN